VILACKDAVAQSFFDFKIDVEFISGLREI
jgi:hypothetical protein